MNETPGPRVWLLASPRLGELGQQRRLAEIIGEPWQEKRIATMAQASRPAFGWSERDAASCGLVPPWPALAVSFGKTLPAALWVRRASGGRTRIVHLGRPRGVDPSAIDLILPMPQDAMPPAANVLPLRYPLNVPPALASSVTQAARARLERLPRPWTALIIGAPTRHYRLRLDELRRLVRCCAAEAASEGGSLLVSDSPRTPAGWLRRLRDVLQGSGVPHEIAEYQAGTTSSRYAEYLALAERFVLTGDTASMIADCLRTGRPVTVLPLRPTLRNRAKRSLRRALPPRLERRLLAGGFLSAPVALDTWIETLASQGSIRRFGEPWSAATGRVFCDDDRDAIRSRALGLLAEKSAR